MFLTVTIQFVVFLTVIISFDVFLTVIISFDVFLTNYIVCCVFLFLTSSQYVSKFVHWGFNKLKWVV